MENLDPGLVAIFAVMLVAGVGTSVVIAWLERRR